MAAAAMDSIPQRRESNTEKPLPLPPRKDTAETPVTVSPTEPAPLQKRPSLSSTTSFQRSKKRIPWRGKQCVIALPLEGGKDDQGKPKQYLKPDEVQQRLKKFEQDGFSTQGFNITVDGSSNEWWHGQSRNIYPDPRETTSEFHNKKYRVRVPDKKAWQNYVNDLQEAKLRALGVLGADEEPARNSPTPSASMMSRQTSTPNSIMHAMSMSQSTNGVRSPFDSTFSPPLPPNYVRQNTMSPQLPQGPPAGFHFPRQSMAVSSESNFNLGNHFPHHSISPGTFQNNIFGSLPSSRGASPFIDARRQSVRNMASPIPTIPEPAEDQYRNISSLLPHMRSNESSVKAPIPEEKNEDFLSDPEPEEEEEEPVEENGTLKAPTHVSRPDIASPLPQGHYHRKNISATLQKEIDEAESHLEQNIVKQLEEPKEDAEESQKTLDAIVDEYAQSTPETQEVKVAANESPKLPAPKPIAEEPAQDKSEETPKKSKLNVKAAEFVFDPSKPAFNPTGMFSFGGSSGDFGSFTPPRIAGADGMHSKNESNTSFGSGLNVAAPAFTPGKFPPPAGGVREFSFSSAIPASVSGTNVDSDDGSFNPERPAPKIFGEINLTDMIKPAKKSKAIPIVNPQSMDEKESDAESEDDEGRINEPPGRQKKARRGDDDGDQVPLFATPSPEPTSVLGQEKIQEGMPQVSQPKEQGKITPENENTLIDLGEEKSTPVTKAKARFADEPARDMANGSPVSSSLTPNKSRTPEKKSRLSPNAKSFHLNPGAGNFMPDGIFGATPEEVAPPPAPEKKPTPPKKTSSGGLGASRYAVPESETPSIVGAREQAMKDRIIAGVSYVDPTDKEIDEVFQELGNDSDKGVERNVEDSYDTPNRYRSSSNHYRSPAQDPVVGAPKNKPDRRPNPEELAATSSPNQLRRPFQYLPNQPELGSTEANAAAEFVQKNARLSPSFKSKKKLNSGDNWDDAISSSEEGKFHARSSFFDNRIDELVGGLLEKRLQPLEQNLSTISQSLAELSKGGRRQHRSVSAEVEHSDADDEDDDNGAARPMSPVKDRRFDKLKASVLDSIQKETPPPQNNDELDKITQALVDLKMSLAMQLAETQKSPTPQPPANTEEFEELKKSLAELKQSLLEKAAEDAEKKAEAPPLAVPNEEMDELRRTLAELKTSLAEQAAERSERKPPTPPAPAIGPEEYVQLQQTLSELKSSVDRPAEPNMAGEALSMLMEKVAELKSALNEQNQQQKQQRDEPSEDFKTALEEAITKSMREKTAPAATSDEAATAEKLQMQVQGLESMMKSSEARAEEEIKARRTAEDTLADTRRLLKAAEEDRTKHRESAEEAESSLRSFLESQQEAKLQIATLEEVKSSLEKSNAELSDKYSSLQDDLEDYKASYKEAGDELDETKTHIKNLDDENKTLDRTINSLREELEEGIKSKQALKEKFERLQENMAETARTITRDQSQWRHKEEEHKAKHELMNARLEAEARTRERLEQEISRLESQEKDAMKAKFLVEQIRGENKHMVTLVNDLRSKHNESAKRADAYEREVHHLKENNRLEIDRIMKATKSDVGAANQQVNIIRENLEGVIERQHSQIESIKAEAAKAKKRHDAMLEEASQSKENALREQAEAREAALQEHYRFHERTIKELESANARTIEELQAQQDRSIEEQRASHARIMEEIHGSHERALTELKADHERNLARTVEDHGRELAEMRDAQEKVRGGAQDEQQRSLQAMQEDKRIFESEYKSRLALADEKAAHFQERVSDLEQKLEVAQTAAAAAAEAASRARVATPQPQVAKDKEQTHASMRIDKDSELPEKISPQALRESIMVLQEQLHQRESQIEKLEEELGQVDKEAPNKIKERDVEITWLRELLGVRLDDLQDIIQTLSAPEYDRDAVRDAAIRLKANLQMEQQEKERAMAGGNKFPSLSSIAASPRSLPLAAAAAWGSWRKGQPSLGSVAEMATPSNSTSASQTPSKTSPQSFLSGLLTPPSTSMRRSPQSQSARRTGPGGPGRRTASSASNYQRPQRQQYQTPKRQLSTSSHEIRKGKERMQLEPEDEGDEGRHHETPPLLRNASYDQDAQSGHYSLDRYINEAEDEEAISSGEPSREPSRHGDDERRNQRPHGPSIELES